MKEDTASSTAFTVLQGLLMAADCKPFAPLVSPAMRQAARHLLSATEPGRKRLAQVESRLFRTIAPLGERLLMPGISRHYVIRKTFFEHCARQAIADGYRQIVNVGAGFDLLCWTLHSEAPAVSFIEIDHPATSRLKQEAVHSSKTLTCGPNLHFLEVDLGEKSLEASLRSFAPFDPDLPTIFLCEGVLMYLPIAAVQAYFAAVKNLTGPGTRTAFTAVTPMESPDNNTGLLLRAYLSTKGEPLAWTLEQGALTRFVTDQGFCLRDHGDTAALTRRYVSPDLAALVRGPQHKGEFMALAEAQ